MTPANLHRATLPLEVVQPLCSEFSKQADWILSLYEMTRGEAEHPGKCVSCFYRLLGAAKGRKREALQPLKRWIETNLQIEIRAGERAGGRLPVTLEEPDLESFCQRVMDRVRSDAVLEGREIGLSFCYKPAGAAA